MRLLNKILKYLELKREAMVNPPKIMGRRRSKQVVWCDCGWLGFWKDLLHFYDHDVYGEVDDYIDRCPRCNKVHSP